MGVNCFKVYRNRWRSRINQMSSKAVFESIRGQCRQTLMDNGKYGLRLNKNVGIRECKRTTQTEARSWKHTFNSLMTPGI